MPLVRVHKASDGALFENHDDYVAHQEGITFDKAWNENFGQTFANDPALEDAVKEFVQVNQDTLVSVIQGSKVKRTGKKKK